VKVVQASLARVVGRHCRFAGRRGRLGPPRSCARPVWIKAKARRAKHRPGKTYWSLRIKGALTPGSYVARVRRKRRTGVARFRVR
jgi:hypothetical protein